MRRLTSKLLCGLLALILMLASGSCSASGVPPLDRLLSLFRPVQPGKNVYGDLEPAVLVQKLVTAIKEPSRAGALYDSIPERQRARVSRDELIQYAHFLRRGVIGEITYFGRMSEADEESNRQQLLAVLPDHQQLIASLQGYWINYQEPGSRQGRFAVYVQLVSDQQPTLVTLSNELIRNTLLLRDTAQVYYLAVEQGNLPSMRFLLSQSGLPDEIIEQRIARLVDFYRQSIVSQPNDFRLVYARLNGIEFESYYADSKTGTQYARLTRFNLQADGSVLIEDPVPETLNLQDLDLYASDQLLLRIGQGQAGQSVTVQSEDLIRVLGGRTSFSLPLILPLGNDRMRISDSFRGLDVQAEGQIDADRRWTGEITLVRLLPGVVRLGSGLAADDAVWDVLSHYPFLDSFDYIVWGRAENGRSVRLRFLLEDERVSSIEIQYGAG